MLMANSLWSIWRNLGVMPKLFLLLLSVVALYSSLSAVVILARLRTLKNSLRHETSPPIENSLAALLGWSASVRQMIGAAFYLFGLVFFMGLPSAFYTLDHSRTPGWVFVFESLGVYFSFAINVFFVLLVLHLTQWFVVHRVRVFARRLGVGLSE